MAALPSISIPPATARAPHDALSRESGPANQPKDLDWAARNIPCQAACPAHTRIPSYLDAIAHGDYDAAYRINLEDNVFPGVLGRVCARPCEPACRHSRDDLGESVAICSSKRAAADYATQQQVLLEPLFPATGMSVAIIGSGPAGLAAARDLARCGHRVCVYEQHAEPGGMMVLGIPAFRLPRDVVRHEIEQVRALGVEIRCGVKIGQNQGLSLVHMLSNYDAVIMAAGTLHGNESDLPGHDCGGVQHGLDFLVEVNLDQQPRIGRHVLIIGGGFTAMDCARTALRLGVESVRICYRRSRTEMPVSDEELEQVVHEGVPIDYQVSPVEFLHDDTGQVRAVRFIRTELGTPGADGRRSPVPILGSDFEVDADTVLLAIGQVPDTSWIDGGLRHRLLDARHRLRGGGDDLTAIDKLFVAGDYALGATTLIDAIGHARRCARHVDSYLCGGERLVDIVTIEPAFETGRRRRMDYIQRHPMPNLPLDERLLTAEVDTGYAPKIAHEAARRCYLCQFKFEINNDICIYCEKCLKAKPRPDCIVRADGVELDAEGRISAFTPAADPTPGNYPLLLIDQDQCIRCGACVEVCPVECISLEKVTAHETKACAIAELVVARANSNS